MNGKSMPAKDSIHNIVKNALIKDGWTITHDPLPIRLGKIRVYADLGAERVIAAERQDRKIAVEIKSFVGLSVIDDLEKALGQYSLYSALLATVDTERILYLAIDKSTFFDLFDTSEGHFIIRQLAIRIIVVSLTDQEVTQWIS
jgi:hypothetical protein